MIVAPARPDDLQTLVVLRDQASQWLATRGIDEWSAPWPSKDLMAEGFSATFMPVRPSSGGTAPSRRHHHHRPDASAPYRLPGRRELP
jgi:hypothetical protein